MWFEAITANSGISVTDVIRAGCTLSTFSEMAIGSSISMSRCTRLGGDLSAAAVVRFGCIETKMVQPVLFVNVVELDGFKKLSTRQSGNVDVKWSPNL